MIVKSITLFLYTIALIFPLYIFTSLIARLITDYKYDRKLGIKTNGLRSIKGEKLYNRTESTPYLALRKFAKEYKVSPESRMVDIGAGKGRVSIYLSKQLSIPVTGIEINELTFNEFVDNVKLSKGTEVYPVFEYAEKYQPKASENIYFLFNPFHANIFEKALSNIVKDSNENNKRVEVILYYPLKSFVNLLESRGFNKLIEYRYIGSISPREKFVIYELDNSL